MIHAMVHSSAGKVALLAAASALLLSGCDLLYPDLYSDFDDLFMDSEASEVYESGSATLTVDGETRELDLRTGSFDSLFGANVVFADDEGWAVTLMGIESDMGPGLGFAELAVHRAILGHWVARDWQAPCDIDIEEAAGEGFRGTASCEGLRWTDAITEMSMLGSSQAWVDGEPPFDATVTFSAQSAPSPAGSSATQQDGVTDERQ